MLKNGIGFWIPTSGKKPDESGTPVMGLARRGIMSTKTWMLNDKVLDAVTGKDERTIREKQDMLRRNFIGKEITEWYSPKRQAKVYLIGHTNRIITQSEFETYMKHGMIDPYQKPVKTMLRHTSKIVAPQPQQPVDDVPVQNTDSITITEPQLTYDVRPATESVAPKLSRQRPVTAEARKPTPAARSIAMPRRAAVPVSAIAQSSDYRNAAYALEQTGMMQAINASDFFDMDDTPSFTSFKAEKHSGNRSIMDRITGFFKRSK